MTTICLVIIAVLQLLDIYTTYRILSAGGVELNGKVALCIEKFGLLPGLLIIKGWFTLILVGVSLIRLPEIGINIRAAFFGLIALGYGWVVLHNLKQMKR